MSSFPKELLIAFGMVDMDWSTILGFFGLVFVFIQICLAIQAANYGFSLVSIEETEWTADFLLSKPVGRRQIMTSKLLAAVSRSGHDRSCSFGFTSLIYLILFRGDQLIPLTPMLLLLFSMPVFQFFFLSVGMLISLLVKRVRSVTPFSMGLVFGLYILNAFGDMIGEESMEILSPFKHFAPSVYHQEQRLEYAAGDDQCRGHHLGFGSQLLAVREKEYCFGSIRRRTGEHLFSGTAREF